MTIRKRRFLMAALFVMMFFMISTTVAYAYSTSKDGVTMWYFLSKSGSTYNAQTYCYEDKDSMVSMFLYTSNGGSMLYSDIAYGRTRIPVPGSSATMTYAGLSKTKASAHYARSVHALLEEGQYTPYISGLELTY